VTITYLENLVQILPYPVPMPMICGTWGRWVSKQCALRVGRSGTCTCEGGRWVSRQCVLCSYQLHAQAYGMEWGVIRHKKNPIAPPLGLLLITISL
jgi:hypothetical protein